MATLCKASLLAIFTAAFAQLVSPYHSLVIPPIFQTLLLCYGYLRSVISDITIEIGLGQSTCI